MSLLQLSDARAYLNITDSTSDAELQTFIDSAEGYVGSLCGPLSPTAMTSRVQGGTDSLILPVTPCLSLTSITPVYPGQPALDLTWVTLNPSGLVTYQGFAGYFAYWAYDVAYTAGWASVPPTLLMAVKELMRHQWMTQRGSSRTRSSDEPYAPGYLVPYRVADLLAAYAQPGFA